METVQPRRSNEESTGKNDQGGDEAREALLHTGEKQKDASKDQSPEAEISRDNINGCSESPRIETAQETKGCNRNKINLAFKACVLLFLLIFAFFFALIYYNQRSSNLHYELPIVVSKPTTLSPTKSSELRPSTKPDCEKFIFSKPVDLSLTLDAAKIPYCSLETHSTQTCRIEKQTWSSLRGHDEVSVGPWTCEPKDKCDKALSINGSKIYAEEPGQLQISAQITLRSHSIQTVKLSLNLKDRSMKTHFKEFKDGTESTINLSTKASLHKTDYLELVLPKYAELDVLLNPAATNIEISFVANRSKN